MFFCASVNNFSLENDEVVQRGEDQDWDGEARTEPRISMCVGPPSRLSTSFALPLPDDLADDLAFDKRQPFVPTEVWVGQLVLIEPQLMQDRGVDIAEVIGALDGSQADVIGSSDHLTTFHATAGHPHRESQVVMVATLAGFGFG